MGFLSRLSAAAGGDGRPAYGPDHDFWYYPVVGLTPAGMVMTPELAMRSSVIYRCVDNIATDLASVPCLVYRRLADGGKERATSHPLYDVLRWQPNVQQTAFEFWQMMIGHLLLRGNAYAEIVPGPRGFVDQLIPLHPGRMRVQSIGNGRVRYQFTKADGTPRTFVQDEIFHLRGLSSDGIEGLSVVSMASEGIWLHLAMEAYDTRFFSQDARPGGVLTTDQALDERVAKALAQQWQELHGGVQNAHKVAVLEQGLKWQQVGMSAKDSQLVENRELTVRDLCRWYRMPPHKVMDLKDAHHTNIEQQNIEYVTDAIRPWAVCLEQVIRRDLVLATDSYFVEFLLDALMRGDAASRTAYYHAGIQDGWLNRNEAREKENLNPRPGLNAFLEPRNMAPAGSQETGAAPGRARSAAAPPRLAVAAAERILRKELGALEKLAERHAADPTAWRASVAEFYDEHLAFVMQAGCLDEDRALAHVGRQRRAVLLGGLQATTNWMDERGPALAVAITEASWSAAA